MRLLYINKLYLCILVFRKVIDDIGNIFVIRELYIMKELGKFFIEIYRSCV